MRIRRWVSNVFGHFQDLSAVRFVYQYVAYLKARLQMINLKLPKPAPAQWQNIHIDSFESILSCKARSVLAIGDTSQRHLNPSLYIS